MAHASASRGLRSVPAILLSVLAVAATACSSPGEQGPAGPAGALDQAQVDAINASIDALIPPGTILPFAGASVPAGYLPCDGTEVSRTTYARLFAAIGIAHGGGDGTTTFAVPDYRGRFLRGVDGTAGRDPDKALRTAPQPTMSSVGNSGNLVGSVQGYATALPVANVLLAGGGPFLYKDNSGWSSANTPSSVDNTPGESGTRSDLTRGATAGDWGGGNLETRPANAYVNWMIRY